MMSGSYLKSSRVLVVDDNPIEALPIIMALSRSGIGCIYQRGDEVENLPEKPFEGIRVVFLDLHLAQEGEHKTVLSKTISVLKKLVEPGTMPLFIICWTKHEEDIQLFSRMVVQDMPGLRPGFIKDMPKPSSRISFDQWKDPEKLRELEEMIAPEIESIINLYQPLHIIWDWEQVVHDAISRTTQALADVVTEGFEKDDKTIPKKDDSVESLESGKKILRGKWLEDLEKVQRSLVKAESGQTADQANAVRELFNILNTLISDKINHAILNKTAPYSAAILPKEDETISETQKARLNQMLMVEPVSQDDVLISPGNIYLPDEDLRENCVHRLCKFEFDKILNEMIDSKNDPEIKQLNKKKNKLEKKIKGNLDDKKVKDELNGIQENIEKISSMIPGKCKPILVEISPACDFSQNKRPVTRLIGGILVPVKYKECLKKAECHYDIEPLYLPNFEEILVPVLNARYQFGVSDPENTINNKPLCRFRSQVLVDIQSWAASRTARPGKLSIR